MVKSTDKSNGDDGHIGVVHPRRMSGDFKRSSLPKPNNEIKPEQQIITRLDGWKSLLKHIIGNLEQMAQAERETSFIYDKISKNWNPITKERTLAFQESSAIHNIVDSLKASQKTVASNLEAISLFYETRAITAFHSLLQDIKQWQDDITYEKINREKARSKEFAEIESKIKQLNNRIDVIKSATKEPNGISINFGKKEDPWYLSLLVKYSIKNSTTNYNARVKSINEEILTYKEFEQSLINSIKSVIATLFNNKDSNNLNEIRTKMFKAFFDSIESLNPAKEWESFSNFNGGFETREKQPAFVCEALEDSLSKIAKQGSLEIEDEPSYFFILTAAGSFFEYASEPNFDDFPNIPKANSIFDLSNFSVNLDSEDEKAFVLVGQAKLLKKPFQCKYRASSKKEAESWYTLIKQHASDPVSVPQQTQNPLTLRRKKSVTKNKKDDAKKKENGEGLFTTLTRRLSGKKERKEKVLPEPA